GPSRPRLALGGEHLPWNTVCRGGAPCVSLRDERAAQIQDRIVRTVRGVGIPEPLPREAGRPDLARRPRYTRRPGVARPTGGPRSAGCAGGSGRAGGPRCASRSGWALLVPVDSELSLGAYR